MSSKMLLLGAVLDVRVTVNFVLSNRYAALHNRKELWLTSQDPYAEQRFLFLTGPDRRTLHQCLPQGPELQAPFPY